MTRWHQPWCQTPQVLVKGKDDPPRCKTCDSFCPSKDELRRAQAGVLSPSTLPAEQPRGQMDLYWPARSLYHSATGSNETRSSSEQKDRDDIASTSLKQKALNAHVYPQSLDDQQLRLVYMSSTPRKDYPVHIYLEVYDRAYRPEYEAVSYMWGGEDGDSTPSEPVYIGPYWDVILQTRNCHAMLLFVRPWRGIRMLWVDAVCINQQDLKEREVQVAGMRQTYEDCIRVVVYLGSDIIEKRGSFPKYTSLDKMDWHSERRTSDTTTASVNGSLDLSRLLLRNYFSRVWMIQELTMSPRAVIRIGKTDFYADGTTIERISVDFSWELTAAPWMQYLGGRISTVPPSPAKALLHLASLSVNCHASDPRDKLFAILPLLPGEFGKALPPNYALPFKDFSIGLFGHVLLVLRSTSLLGKAGMANRSSNPATLGEYPSWVPMCRSHDEWSAVFNSEDTSQEHQWGAERWSVADYVRLHPVLDETMLISPYHENSDGLRLAGSFSRARMAHDSLLDAYIDPKTGALILNLTHLVTFDRVPTVTKMRKRLYQYAIIPTDPEPESTTDQFNLGFVAPEMIEIQPFRDHIFRLTMGQDHIESLGETGAVNLILREVTSEQGMPTYVLLSSSVCFVGTAFGGLGSPFAEDFQPTPWHHVPTNLDPYLDMTYLWISVADAFEEILSIFWTLRGHSEISPFVPGFTRDKKDWTGISMLCKAFWGHCENELLKKKSKAPSKTTLAPSVVPPKISFRRDSHTFPSREMKNAMKHSGYVWHNGLFVFLKSIAHTYTPPLEPQALFNMIAQGPTEAQQDIGIIKYLGGVKMDGSVHQVRII